MPAVPALGMDCRDFPAEMSQNRDCRTSFAKTILAPASASEIAAVADAPSQRRETLAMTEANGKDGGGVDCRRVNARSGNEQENSRLLRSARKDEF